MKSPVGFRGKAPVGVLGDEVPQKLKQFADVVYRFWLQKQSKFENFYTIEPLILDQYVLRQGAKQHFAGGLTLKPSLASPLMTDCDQFR